MERALDKQVGGSHYKNFKIQPVEFVHANQLDFIQGTIVKYICRFRNKGGKQDLEKIKHFVDLLIELEYPDDIVRANLKQKIDEYYDKLDRKSATAVGRMP